jgi:uncharacterized coiled-coil protein SlyX
MRTCKCEHWEVCPVCKPEWFDSEGNRLPPEPTPLQKANGRIEELEQHLAEREKQVTLLREALENYEGMLDELRDYPITHDLIIEALAATQPKEFT